MGGYDAICMLRQIIINYCDFQVYKSKEYSELLRDCFYGAAIIALILRVFFILSTIIVFRNFGRGLKERGKIVSMSVKLLFKETTLIIQFIPVKISNFTFLFYYVTKNIQLIPCHPSHSGSCTISFLFYVSTILPKILF